MHACWFQDHCHVTCYYEQLRSQITQCRVQLCAQTMHILLWTGVMLPPLVTGYLYRRSTLNMASTQWCQRHTHTPQAGTHMRHNILNACLVTHSRARNPHVTKQETICKTWLGAGQHKPQTACLMQQSTAGSTHQPQQ